MAAFVLGAVGFAAGGALAFGALGRSRHWAVRVLCALAGVAAVPAWLVGSFLAGRDAWQAEFCFRAALAFAVVSAVLAAVRMFDGARWIAAGGSRRALVAAGVVAVIAVGGALVWRGDSAKAVPVAATVPEAAAVTAVSEMPVGQSAAVDCQCDAGRLCTGPRGGRYCVAADGRKRYQ